MIIEHSKVVKMNITDIEGLDTVSVYLEDFEPRKGSITINCYGESWTSYWGAMGDRTISEFFISCDNHYIAKNLSGVKSEINDYQALSLMIESCLKEEVFEPGETSRIRREIKYMGDDSEWDVWIQNNYSTMRELFGYDCWTYEIPKKVHPRYKYLCRIIETVKAALIEVRDEEKTSVEKNCEQ